MPCKLLIALEHRRATWYAKSRGLADGDFIIVTPDIQGRGRSFPERDVVWVDPKEAFSQEFLEMILPVIRPE